MALEILSQVTNPSKDFRFRASHMAIKHDNQRIDFPQFSASKADYEKASQWNKIHDDTISIDSKIFQYHVNIDVSKIMTSGCKELIKEYYGGILDDHSPIIRDFNFTRYKGKWVENERTTALELQKDLKTSFLSDVVMDHNMEIGRFEEQLDDLDGFDKTSIKCPTISSYAEPRIFLQQLNSIIERKYERFNVEWAGISTSYQNWLALDVIADKKIWCNLVNIFQRRQLKHFRSNAMIGFIHGFHTCGLGFKQPRTPNSNRPWELTESTYRYQRVNGDENEFETDSYKKFDTISHNLLQRKALESHAHIDKQTFFSEFFPSEFTERLPQT